MVVMVALGTALAALRRAFWASVRRMSVAIWISVSTIGRAELLALLERGDELVDLLGVVALAQFVEGLAAADAHVHLPQGDAEFVGPGPLVLLGDPLQRLPEAESGGDDDGEDVEEVGQGALDDVACGRGWPARCRRRPQNRPKASTSAANSRLPAREHRRGAMTTPKSAVDGAAGGVAVDGQAAGVAGLVDLAALRVDPLGAHQPQHERGVAHAERGRRPSRAAVVRVAPTSRATARSRGSLVSARYMRMPCEDPVARRARRRAASRSRHHAVSDSSSDLDLGRGGG